MAGYVDRGPSLGVSSKRHPLSVDPWLAASAAILLLVGLMAIYSEGLGRQEGGYFHKQLIWLLIGMVPFGLFLRTPPSFWHRTATTLYVLNLACLALVLRSGHMAGHAQRWIQIGSFQFQPSEMSKLLTILTVSAFFANRMGEIRAFKTFALSLVHMLPPLILVFKQPHLGATLVLLAAWFGVCICAGVPWKYLLGTTVFTAAALGIALNAPGILKPYQRERFFAMFKVDEQGSDYQQLRASIAFGVGGISGTGYLKGEQKAGHYIPEQHNDFIFSVVGEEGGLIGSTLTLAAFGFFFFRAWLVLFKTTEPFHRMIVGGILSVLGFHTIVNLGMNLQILPVVGLWLPFMSYGGTALWLCLACLGLLLNIDRLSTKRMF